MFYEKDLTIAAGTARQEPAEASLYVVPGVVHYVEIQFPAGCAGLAHVVIEHQEVQVWPANKEGSFKSDGWNVGFNEAYEVGKRDTHFKIKGWNNDDTYEHTITVRLGVLRREDMFPLWTVFKAIQLFFKLFRPRAEEEVTGD